MLYLISLGLAGANDISIKGLEALRQCDMVYVDTYTSVLPYSLEDLQNIIGKKVDIRTAGRELAEQAAELTILSSAKEHHVAFLVLGDVFSATTHIDLVQRARSLKIPIHIIHNASVLTAVGATGLQLYKFGKTASIPFENDIVETPYRILEQNKSIGAHTLFLLDLHPSEKQFLTIADALAYLFRVESRRKKGAFSSETFCIGCARLGSATQVIHAGTAHQLAKVNFGAPPYCFIVPAELHFMEEEFLRQYALDERA